MDRASQKILVPSRTHTALCRNIDTTTPTPSSGSTPSKHPALLVKQSSQSHCRQGVLVSTWCDALEDTTASYREGTVLIKENLTNRLKLNKLQKAMKAFFKIKKKKLLS